MPLLSRKSNRVFWYIRFGWVYTIFGGVQCWVYTLGIYAGPWVYTLWGFALRIVPVKMPDDLIARIGAVSGNRSEWVREACELRLSGERPAPLEREPERLEREKPAVAERPKVVKPASRDWLSRGAEVLAVLPEHRFSVPALAKRLGWSEMLLLRVLAALEADGQIRIEAGKVVAA